MRKMVQIKTPKVGITYNWLAFA